MFTKEAEKHLAECRAQGAISIQQLSEQPEKDAAALRRFLLKHGKPCPSFHAEAELGISHKRFLAAAERIGAKRTKWNFWEVG